MTASASERRGDPASGGARKPDPAARACSAADLATPVGPALELVAAASARASAPFGERAASVLDALRDRLGAAGVAAVLVVDAAGARATIASSGELALDAAGEPTGAARFPIVDGATLFVAPASRAAGEAAALCDLAARVVARELDLARREARASRAEDAISAVTHEMNNALTPLLCSSSEPVARDALRLRSLLDTLRQLRGRSHPRELRAAPAWLERAKRLLSIAGAGTVHIDVECAEEARGLTIGPEQGRLLPAVLTTGFALRASAPGAVRVAARVEDGRLVIEVSAPVSTSLVAGDLDLPSGPELEARLAPSTGGTRVAFRLAQRPRVVVIEGPTRPGTAVARALAPLGVEVTLVEGAAALGRVLEWPEPSAILVLHEAQAQGNALRVALHRAQPVYASRCLFLDERLAPRHYRASPDEVDLAAALAAAHRAPPPAGGVGDSRA